MGTDNQNSQDNATPQEPKVFTQEEVNSFLAKDRKQTAEKYADYEALKEKAARLDEIEAANKSELEKANEKAAQLESELKAIKEAEKIREIRESVAKETGIPAHLLTGSTKEECEAQATAIADYAKPTPYPAVKDAGEVNNVGKPTTRQQFAEWSQQIF